MLTDWLNEYVRLSHHWKEGRKRSFTYPKAQDILGQVPNPDSKTGRQEARGEEERMKETLSH